MVSKSLVKTTTAAELTKQFAASDGVDIRAGRYAIPLVPVDINVFALDTGSFTESLWKCWDGVHKDVTNFKSLCDKYSSDPEVSNTRTWYNVSIISFDS